MRRLATTFVISALLACGGGDEAPSSSGAGGTGGQATGGQGGAPATTGPGGSVPFPNVARVMVPASFTPSGSGSFAFGTGDEVFDVAQAFYADHPDDYDFLVMYTDFRVDEIWQFEITTRADIAGIGQEIVYQQYYGWPLDYYVQAGSSGALQALVFMNDPALWDTAAYTAQEILTHEVGHRWGASMVLENNILIDGSFSHWAKVAGVGGPSALGYGQLIDEGGGMFRHERVSPLAYAPLELYAMGLLPPDDPSLADLFYVTGAANEDEVGGAGTLSFTGTRNDLSIAAIEQALGIRLPAFGQSQTAFRFAFLLVCDGECSADNLAWVDAQRLSWEATFATATGDRASATTNL